jgi:rhodanese-related sulfurtransferase
MKSISAKQFKQVMDGDKPFDLVDVRPNKDYRHNHIPGAVNVPFTSDFVDVLEDTLMGDKDIVVVVYDAHEESDLAERAIAVMVNELGYENAMHLDGGIMGWMEKGYKVEFGRES